VYFVGITTVSYALEIALLQRWQTLTPAAYMLWKNCTSAFRKEMFRWKDFIYVFIYLS